MAGGSAASITGISSGIDWQSLVNSIIAADKVPATAWQKQIDANTARKTALDTLGQNLTSLQTASDALKYGAGFNTYSVTATGTASDGSARNVLAATADNTASAGTYAVTVQRLAQAQKTIGTIGQASTSAALGVSGGLTFTSPGGQPVTVNVASTDSLSALRANINAVQGETGVQASIVSGNADGSDAHLVLTAAKTGSAGGFTVADASGTTPSLTAALGLGAPAVAAQDAQFTVDGVTVTRASNTVADAIGGVTLSLAAVGSSSVTLNRQPDQAQAAVQIFVDSYNKIQQFIQQQNTIQSDGTFPPLHNDPTLRDAQSQLASMMLTSGSASNGVASDLATLASVGVSLQKDGTLKLDGTTFQSALSSRLSDVSALFTDRMSAFSTYADNATTPYVGTISTRESVIDAQSTSLQSRIDNLNEREDKKRLALLTQYSKFEASLSQLQATGSALSAQFASLTSSSNS
ncbi:flagellar hook-associated protein 2 [Gemmatimonadetes bacterium T265]|nr:flagellar hook-associated protein 2 [Gemmatimonadetes bacterium T265]